ncbi:MAG: HAD family hydrolase [Nakamurella sp.]
MPPPAVIFDFDGTIALGSGPLNAYARCIGTVTDERIGRACLAIIEEFDAGTTEFADAYDAVRAVAVELGVTNAQLSAAYLASRKLLATDEAPIFAPEGLGDFMRTLSKHATCVLATNAPHISLDRALETLGVADSISEINADLGKPAGLELVIAAHIARGATLAVGDRWDNDLAPAEKFGAATALVGSGAASGRPTMRGATLTDIYDAILDWAKSPVALHAAPGAVTTTPDGKTTTDIAQPPSYVDPH